MTINKSLLAITMMYLGVRCSRMRCALAFSRPAVSSKGTGGNHVMGRQSPAAFLGTSDISRYNQEQRHQLDAVRLFAASSGAGGGKKPPPRRKQQSTKRQKWKVNENVDPKIAAEQLAAAFDEMARKDGFDSSSSRFADDESFEDDFVFDDLDGEEVDDDIEDGDDEGDEDIDIDDILNSGSFNIKDFQAEANDHDDSEDMLDFGMGGEDDMEARIRAAKHDMDQGRTSIPDDLDQLAQSEANLRALGFKKEINPYGNDETPRKDTFKLITNAMTCSACGSDFQSKRETKAGYLPPEKFAFQQKLAQIEDVQKLQEKAESSEWSTDDEIDFLLQTTGNEPDAAFVDTLSDIDVEAVAQEMDIDLEEAAAKKVICKRCHGLQNHGQVEDALRPGWTDEPTMSQQQFRDLLKPIGQKPAVIIALIDLFDFNGSFLRELDGIAGDNPVIIAANKVDLLPSKMGDQRVENWVRRELEYVGVESLANIGGAVRLVSCKTGKGVNDMLNKARRLADEMDGEIYIVGAANAGKSTLINQILARDQATKPVAKVRAGNRNAIKNAVTTSSLPGTTLKFIKIDLGDGRILYDTPGLLVPGTITQLLTPDELKIVCPKKQVEPITFRVASGKCILIGGLARVEVTGDSKPFLLTFFVANEIKLHPTTTSKAAEVLSNHAGKILTPPLGDGEKRLQEIGEFITHDIDIEGQGWKEASADISLTGLGWIAVTGAGHASIRISVPKGISVAVRPPLMPFDIWESASKYTGGRAVRKVTKSKGGKKRRGVGRN